MLQARRVLVRLAIVLMLALAALPMQAAAAPSDVRLRDYIHTTWTQYDGVPLGDITSILQTSDGYLWIFTSDALLRFDGMRFVRTSTPCTEGIRSRAPAVDGGFWAVCGEKLIRRKADARFVVVSETLGKSVLQHTLFTDRRGRLWILGRTVRYLEPDGTGGRVFDTPQARLGFSAAQDSEGTIWATDWSSLFRFHDDRVELVMTLDGATPVDRERFHCLTPAREGGVLVSLGKSETIIWHLRKGAPPSVFAHVPDLIQTYSAPGCMQEAADGGLWIAAARNAVALVEKGRVETLADTGQIERRVRAVFIDREGAIWAGGTAGLHRFRKPTIQWMRLPGKQTLPWFVFVDSRENLWTGTANGVRRSNPRDATARMLTLDRSYFAIGEDEQGRTWLSTADAIGYVANGTFVAVPDDAGKPIMDVYAFERDRLGHLWALSHGVGMYRVTPGQPRQMFASPRASWRCVVSEDSGVWIAIQGGGVEQHVNGRTNFFPPPPAAGYRVELTMLGDGDSIWVGSRAGLMRLRNGMWTAWTREHGLPGDGSVNAIGADRSGHFWMMTGGGLLRLSRAQLDATPNGNPRPLSFARIGMLDGVVPLPSNPYASPTVTADRSGRLYFTTADAIAIVDPASVAESAMIPPIVLESVTIDDQPVDRTAARGFTEPSRLQFAYTSLSLLSPENARFRYRLEGHDRDWIEAGTQRQVTYGTLRPGAYRFRVIGAGSEGVWNETGASFAFQIVPIFWRTWWFRLSMVALGLTIAGALYRLRIRQLTRQFNRGLEARVGERTRIARELHDTLLQSFQGVVIHFQAATNLLPARPDDAKRKFESVLDQAALAIAEGRDAVQALRESAGTSDDLAHALSVLAEQLAGDAGSDHAATIRVNVEGSPRSLRPIVRDDVYRIASEAMRNAMRHAQARQIHVDIHYDRRALQLRIRDDGTGIDAGVLESRGVSGHWGLPGMRERTELIGGRLDVSSRLGAGTEVELSLPASKAYTAAPGRRRFWPRRRRTKAGS